MKKQYINTFVIIIFLFGTIYGSDTLSYRQVIVLRDKNTLTSFDSIQYRIIVKESKQFKMSLAGHIATITHKEGIKLPRIIEDWNEHKLGNITIKEISENEKEISFVCYMSPKDTTRFTRKINKFPTSVDKMIDELMVEVEKIDSIPYLQSGTYCLGIQLNYTKDYPDRFWNHDAIFFVDTLTIVDTEKTKRK